VLEEADDELQGRESHAAQLLVAAFPVPEGDLSVVDLLQPAVGEGDPEDVPAQVVEHFAAAAGWLTIHESLDATLTAAPAGAGLPSSRRRPS
jgi:hypothetical protein